MTLGKFILQPKLQQLWNLISHEPILFFFQVSTSVTSTIVFYFIFPRPIFALLTDQLLYSGDGRIPRVYLPQGLADV